MYLALLWRIVHDCLPTGHQLNHRHIPADDRCVFCERMEHVEHLFLMCPFASAVWASVKECFYFKLAKKSLTHMKQWVFDFLGRASPVQATLLAVTCWHIWESRNDTRNGKGHLIPVRLAVKIKGCVDNIVQYCFSSPSAKRCESNQGSRWIPPPMGSVCVNVDVTIFSAVQRMGMGMVIRDHSGSVKLTCSEGIAGIFDPELAEALAVRRALGITKHNGFSQVILVSDCLCLIQRICSSVQDRSSMGAVVSDIKVLAAGFSTIMFKHVGRKMNVLAHTLARFNEPATCNLSFSVIPVLMLINQ